MKHGEAMAPFRRGDRVAIKPGKEHEKMDRDRRGTMVEVSTPALAILFDGEDEPHKWYVAGELDKESRGLLDTSGGDGEEEDMPMRGLME